MQGGADATVTLAEGRDTAYCPEGHRAAERWLDRFPDAKLELALWLVSGEAGEKELLDRVFESALEVTRRVVGAVARLTWVTSGYGWLTIAAPISVASPSYLSGKMTFGQLMVAVGAFNQRANLSAMVCGFSRTGVPLGCV